MNPDATADLPTGENVPAKKPAKKRAKKASGPSIDLTLGAAPAPDVDTSGPADVPAGSPIGLDVSGPPQVAEPVVRTLLVGMGGGLGFLIGDDDVPEHWAWTDRELAELVPPLTRVINRNAKLRRAVARGDEMALAMTMAGYFGRNIQDGNAARKERDGRDPDREPEASGTVGAGDIADRTRGDGGPDGYRVGDGPADGVGSAGRVDRATDGSAR